MADHNMIVADHNMIVADQNMVNLYGCAVLYVRDENDAQHYVALPDSEISRFKLRNI